MTEAEWLAASVPEVMLGDISHRTSDRKLRLFATACCRSIWHLLPNQQARTLVTVAERFADGLATENELGAAEGEFTFAEWEPSLSPDPYLAALATEAVEQVSRGSDATAAARRGSVVPNWPEQAYQAALGTSHRAANAVPLDRRQESWVVQVGFIRCVFGNPFRPVSSAPSWLTVTAVALAQQMYESRDFSPMLILADALQDAGCDSADVLDHCRGPGPHVRGCWVVDLVLGKE